MTEIERKYLVAELPADLGDHPSKTILQGYLAIDERGGEVRLRQKGERFFETVKSGHGLERSEAEIELSRAQFEALWSAVGDRQVRKIRYEIPVGDLTLEVDVYDGPHAGLVTAEVEFTTVEASRSWEPPGWLGLEVTLNESFKNRNLALRGLPPL